MGRGGADIEVNVCATPARGGPKSHSYAFLKTAAAGRT
jgi:hypothetical protein